MPLWNNCRMDTAHDRGARVEMLTTNRRAGVVTGVLIILSLAWWFVFHTAAFTCWDFRTNLWGPSYLLTQGQSPYKLDQLFELGNAVWMPMIVGLFFPLGFLSLQQASNLWFLVNIVSLLCIVWISLDSRRPSVLLFASALLLSLFFPPTVTHIWAGQISIPVTLAMLTLAIWHDEMHIFWLAALMAIGLSKPQLAILVLPGLMIYRLKAQGFQKTFQLGLYVLGCILVFLIPLFIAYPNWIPDFVSSIQQNPSWAHPSSLYFLRTALPGIGTQAWVVLAVVVFILNLRLWMTLPQRDAAYWSLALTTLISPYIWTWDFVLLLPLFISSLSKAKTKFSLGILLAGCCIGWGWVTAMKLRGDVQESLFWWMPWVLVAFMTLSDRLQNQNRFSAEHSRLPNEK